MPRKQINKKFLTLIPETIKIPIQIAIITIIEPNSGCKNIKMAGIRAYIQKE